MVIKDTLIEAITRRWIRQVREEQHLRKECLEGRPVRIVDAEPTKYEIWNKINEVKKELDNETGIVTL